MSLLLQGVSCPLGDFTLSIDVELQTHVTAIFGRSGAGKTTLLDIIAGIRRPDQAVIEIDGRLLNDTKSNRFVPPHRRRIGYVPQDLALFPHLSVRENLLYGFSAPPELEPSFTLADVMEMLDIVSLLNRRIHQLSGGEKQRVALGRALLSAPCLLLLDEPLASLDSALKERILPYLRRIREIFQFPILYVTHDPQEVTALCDEVLILDQGRLIGRGPPDIVLR